MQERIEWLKNRQKGIGSSDAAAVHNESPYCTALELYEDKIADVIDEDTSYIMSKGNQYEPIIRKLFAAEYNIENLTEENFEPRNMISLDLPILMASLDAWSPACIAEFKYQGLEAHKRVSEGYIAPNYLWQIQHQLLVSGAPHAWLVSYNPKDENKVLRKMKIIPDQDMWCRHIEACQEFWARVQRRDPPPASEKDFTIMRNKGAKAKAKRYLYLKSKIDELDEELSQVRDDLLINMTHPKMKCYGLRIQKIVAKGNVEYSKIEALKGINLEQYRGKSKEYYKFDTEK